MYICRICLDPNIAKDMTELPLHLNGEAANFEEVVFFCLNIQVTQDSESYRKLCTKCFDSLLSFYKFKSVALKNNNYIHTFYSKRVDGLDSPPSLKIELDIEEYENYHVLEPEIITDPVEEDDLPLNTLKAEETKLKIRELALKQQKNEPDLTKHPTLQTCKVCGDRVSDLPEHLLTHDSVTSEAASEHKVPCRSCEKVFPTRQQMLRHLRLQHAPKTKCEECAESVLCLTHHARALHDKSSPKAACAHCRLGASGRAGPNQCAQCPKSFRKKHRLDAHVQRYHAEKKSLQCQYCPEKFSAYCSLHKHEATHSLIEEDTKPKPDTIKTENDAAGSNQDPGKETGSVKDETGSQYSKAVKKLFKCVECGEEFTSRTMMYRHREPKEKRQCDICLKFYGYASLSTHKRIVHHKESLPFGCAHCGRRFLQASKLLDHERTHTHERPYACPHCERRFTQEVALKNHVQNVHEKRRTFICQHCCMGFFQKHNLDKHILRRHSSALPHQCLECGMRFKIVDALKEHASKHTGARPHACSLCGLAFRQRGGLRSHLRTHSSEQPYACRFCGARFKRGDYRRNHERKAHVAEFNDAESKKSFE